MNALERAMSLEKSGIELYNKLRAKCECAVFERILQVRERGAAMLGEFGTSEIFIDAPKIGEISLQDALILALGFELKLCFEYADITANCDDASLKDLCFRLWATSHNEYQVALKSELFGKNATQIAPVKSEDKFDINQILKDEFGEIFEKFRDGKASRDDINKLLANPKFPAFAGLALGGIAGMLMTENNFLKE